MSARARALIDLNALAHNFSLVHTLAPNAKILAMIKANAYGHGLTTVAKNLPADGFGVASLEEAINLRHEGIQQPIVLMAGFLSANELAEIIANKLDIVVHSSWQVQVLSAFAKNYPKKNTLGIWLKIDTGMHRLGINPREVTQAYETLMTLNIVKKPLTLMTHLAQAYGLGQDEKAQTRTQIHCFDDAIKQCQGQQSIANSAALFAWPETHRDWVRPGIMLYGASPFEKTIGADHGLKPVMTLISRLIAINPLKKGDCVGYGGTWCCPEDMKVGAVDIGYGDGYPHHVVPGTEVIVCGERCQIVGRVSMDRICIDLRACPQAQVGDEVILWGRNLPVETIAQQAGTISYELLSQVTARVQVEYR